MQPADLVDLDRYPILDLSAAAARALVAEGRAALADTGACELPGFLGPAGLVACRHDAVALEADAYRSAGTGTAYLEAPDPSWPAEHPRARRFPYAVGTVAYDQFSPASPLRALYEWDPLLDFVAAILGTEVHRYADPLGALNLAAMDDGDGLQWHFDQTDFVVSLALQPSVGGGTFDVVARLRADGDEHYDTVSAVLDGSTSDVRTLSMTPGTLLVFAGRDSLHRVGAVVGDTSRLVLLMGYDTAPGTRSTPALQLARYGRTAP